MSRLVALLQVVALAVMVAGARAQTAPAGNAHPETREVSDDSGRLDKPFGSSIAPAAAVTPADKLAFERAVDLSSLRDAAVFHNGRVKILDTLARETVFDLTGRSRYADPLPDGVQARHDPLFTLIDLAVSPDHYIDRPVIHVNYLPLRRGLLEAAFPGDRDEQERWMRLTRVSPRMVLAFGDEMRDKHMSETGFREGLDRADRALRLIAFGGSNFLMVAPESRDLPWRHVSELPAEHPARAAALRLGEAWRAADAGRVNTAAAELADALAAINPGTHPQSRRALEMAYNRVNAFEWGYWLYLLSLVSLLIAFGTGRRWLAWTGSVLLVGAIGLHATGFVLRCIVAERFAIQNQFESMTGLSLFAAVVGGAIMLARRQWLFGAAAAATGFLVLITATQTDMPGRHIGREAAILNTSVLLKYHVTTVLVSYGLITLGFVCSVFYLCTHYLGRLRAQAVETGDTEAIAAAALNAPDDKPFGRARVLADLDTAQMTVLQLAFWTLGVGILLGAWWADHSWGRWWAFDPKETWALLTWIIYLIVIHLRLTTGRNRGLVTAWLSVVGFVVMLWTYFGVNLLLPGLHAYA